MRKIMNIVPEKITNKWFHKLSSKDRKKLQALQQAREGIYNKRELSIPPLTWWYKQNHVRKSDNYEVYKNKFKSRGKNTNAPSKKEEVK